MSCGKGARHGVIGSKFVRGFILGEGGSLVKCLVGRVQDMGAIGSKYVGGLNLGRSGWLNSRMALVRCLVEMVQGMVAIGSKCVGGFNLGGVGCSNVLCYQMPCVKGAKAWKSTEEV